MSAEPAPPLSASTSGGSSAWRRTLRLFGLDPSQDEAPVMTGEDLGFMRTGAVIGQGRILLVFLLLAFAWAAFAPLQSAILAHGEVVVKTHRKTIQHLQGGTVKQILVSEGQVVKSGQTLMLLDDVLAKANLSVLQGQVDALTAEEARLEAERDGKSAIAFPPELMARRSDPAVAAAMAGEVNAFKVRNASLSQQIGVYGQRTAENDRTIDGMKAERVAVQKQSALIKQELNAVEGLYNQGYVPISRLLALQRQAADLDGQDGQLAGRIAQMEAGNGENRLQGITLKDQKLSDVVKDLRDVETRKFDAIDRLHAAQDTVTHTTLTAPVDGTVVGLAVHTVGAVIKPGETVMEIVPQNDTLDVSARVRPEDADRVTKGMTARINFSSYHQRRLPVITGTVETVSADRLVDEKGQPYFAVMLSVDAKALKDYPEMRLIPGLPVEVGINTGRRTALSYLAEPITEAFRHGMKEQ
ncbi:HlyD family type I secretion periplasmic adaptor subunit [Phenylobacterium montanum]|uniref:Membrane fusion protein (MFP) family protein n=1 Tax=Phenylobacterium montanum TaxID=2823693 RepID=A0A975G4L6_9CAUL|nr:HlyD family type I secretion periplasmic adaptor subunit [Caulobacter sp. S6]QUD90432.1 HlyD family type I secretion periplasmic adaptor subunit [Caulobacter sp. S6]